MSDKPESLKPPKTPGSDTLTPSYHNEKPPPYSAAPVMNSVPKAESTSICQPSAGYETFPGFLPSTAEDTAPLLSSSSSSFDDDTVRRGFIRKVFSLLILQLLFTFSVVCVFTFSTVVKEAVQTNLWAYLSSFIIFAVVAIALIFSESFSRRHPWNVVGLAVVTLSLSYMVGTIASFHDTYAVIITMGVTLVITVSIILFSAQTKWDFTICYGVVLILAVDLIMFGIICIFYNSYITDVVYGCLGALFYSLFLLINCQLMMGVMSFRLDPEEYVSAALTIYLVIILIFLYLLGRR